MHDGDVRKQILALEAQIERLAEVVESCRKVILISKAFTAVGGILMLAMTIGIVRFDPMIMIGALTRRYRRDRPSWFQLEHVAAVHRRPESRGGRSEPN